MPPWRMGPAALLSRAPTISRTDSGGWRRRPNTGICWGSPPEHETRRTFHELKVRLARGEKLNVQARRGYFAPKHSEDAVQSGKQEIEDAVFSRDEIHDLPAELKTQVEKTGVAGGTLTVVANVDMKQVHFRKADGRNRNDLTMVSALFDDNGNYVAGFQKTFELRLLDATVQKLATSPAVGLKMSFDVKPGVISCGWWCATPRASRSPRSTARSRFSRQARASG